eukprot:34221-Prymnesium_polylepis.1
MGPSRSQLFFARSASHAKIAATASASAACASAAAACASRSATARARVSAADSGVMGFALRMTDLRGGRFLSMTRARKRSVSARRERPPPPHRPPQRPARQRLHQLPPSSRSDAPPWLPLRHLSLQPPPSR